MISRPVAWLFTLFALCACAHAQTSSPANSTRGTSRVTYAWTRTNSLHPVPLPQNFPPFLVVENVIREPLYVQYTEVRINTTYGPATDAGTHLYYVDTPARRDPTLSTKVSILNHSFVPDGAGPAPVITEHPIGREVSVGDRVTLTFGGSGIDRIQWQKNGTNIAGATNIALTFNSVTLADAGSYTVVLTNAGGSTTSNPARLTVLPPSTPPTADFGPFKLEPFGSPYSTGGAITDSAIVVTIPKLLKKDFVFLGNTGASVTQYFTRDKDYTIDGAVFVPRRLVPAGKPTGEALGIVFYEAQAAFGGAATALIASSSSPGAVQPGDVRVSDFTLYAIKTVREKNFMIFRYRFMLAVGGSSRPAPGTRYARTAIMDAFTLDFYVGPLVSNSTLNAHVDRVDWDKAGFIPSTASPGPLAARLAGLHVTPGWDSWQFADNLSSTEFRAFNTALQLAPKHIVDVQTRHGTSFGTGNLGHASWTTMLHGDRVAQPAGRTSSSVLEARALELEFADTASGGSPLQLSFWAVLPTGTQFPPGTGTGTGAGAGNGSGSGGGSGSAGGSNGSGPAALGSNPAGPTITSQPRSQVAVPGGTVTFTVAATEAIAYQWNKDGIALPGATASTLSLAEVTAANNGIYTALVRNAQGEENMTTPAALNVSQLAAARLPNLSIRTRLGTEPLIIGYTVGGPDVVGSKPLLVRAIGPTLAQFGVPDVSDDPRMELFRGSTAIASNDNWGGTPALTAAFTSAGAFALDPASKDAALATALESGSFTTHVSSVTSRPGIALAEIYDLYPQNESSDRTPRLVNLSARTHAGTGDDVLIVGFAVDGVARRTVLIRAIGPSLAQFGVTGVLDNPQLELFAGNGSALTANDDWSGAAALSAAFAQVGAFPLDAASRDAALLVTLEPGTYSAKVSGVANTSGTALIEIYEVR